MAERKIIDVAEQRSYGSKWGHILSVGGHRSVTKGWAEPWLQVIRQWTGPGGHGKAVEVGKLGRGSSRIVVMVSDDGVAPLATMVGRLERYTLDSQLALQ